MSANLYLAPAGFAPPQRVGDVIELYLADARNTLQLRSFEGRKQILDDFAAGFGAVALADAKPFLVQLWLNGHPAWASDWTRKGAVAGVQACMNWAVKLGLIPANPFRGFSWPAGERGEPMPLHEFAAMLRHSPPPFRRYVIALRRTGARPGEIASATWPDLDPASACIDLDRHKTRKTSGQSRRIILDDVMLRLITWLARRPAWSRYIFANAKGTRWTQPAISWHLRLLRQAGHIGPTTTLHQLRHEFACQAIQAGIDLPTVGELMGHKRITSTMHYVHMAKKTGHLRDAAARVFGPRLN